MTAAVKPFYRRRPILAGVMALLGLILLLAGAAAIALVTVDFRPFLERRLSRTLDRPVQIGAFQIHWGDPLQVELHDLHVANAGWGSSPDLISVRDVTAALDLRDLLAGRLYFRKLMIAEPIIVLERNAERIGNWRFASSLKTGAAPSIDRAHFPTLLDFTLQGGKITYRTSSGHILQIDLAQATIRTTDDDQPVLLAASGAYNGAALALRAQLQSFRDFRQADKPFGTDLVLSRQTAGLHFAGTMIDPLNVDGAEGPIDLKAARLNDFLSAFGTKLAINPAVDLTGRLKRDGSLWNLMAVKGELGGNALAGQARLQEGARGQPDDIAVEASFKTLDLGNLLATGAQQKESAGGTDWLDQRLDTPDKTAPRLAANLVAEHVSYGGLTFDDVDLATRLAPGEIKLENSRASFAGIRLHLGGGLTPATEGGRLAASLMLDQADAATLVNLLGGKPGDLSGEVSGGATATLAGTTLRQGLRNSDGDIVLSMTSGRISRDFLEKASTDLRSIFRNGKGSARISCLLGVMQLHNGLGTVQTLRLQTGEATLNGKGRVDFLRQNLDLILQSEAKSTGFFALDLPVRINGNWHQPEVDLSGKSVAPRPIVAASQTMSSGLRHIVAANSCHL